VEETKVETMSTDTVSIAKSEWVLHQKGEKGSR
jgi:hypothetical protein